MCKVQLWPCGPLENHLRAQRPPWRQGLKTASSYFVAKKLEKLLPAPSFGITHHSKGDMRG